MFKDRHYKMFQSNFLKEASHETKKCLKDVNFSLTDKDSV